MKYKYLLFDMGNTIIKNIKFDTSKALEKLYEIIDNCSINKDNFINEGIEILNEIFKKRDEDNIEIPYQTYIKNILDRYKINNYDLEKIELEMYKYSVLDEEIFDIKNFLEKLKNNNHELYILSNATFSSNCLKYTLEKFGVLKYFNNVYSSGDVIHRKPSKLFLKETNILNFINLNDSIYIGDNEYYDKEFAKNLNIPFILFKDGKPIFDENNKEIKEILNW